jgi:hypothetical protein
MFTEELDTFFDTDDFALAATYDASATVNVIFDNAYIEALTGVASVNPVALAKTSDVPAAGVGKTLVISGTTYTIRNREPQDDGAVVLLQLEKA